MQNEREILVRSLCFAYRTMLASAPLLRFAIERAEGDLKTYYQQHLMEEEGHDKMVLADLHGLGVTDIPHDFLAAQIAGSQYYFIAHEHPAMLLGYMHALERESPPVAFVDELAKEVGAELTAMRHHALHDPYHRIDLARMIATLPADLRARVQWNERHVYDLFAGALGDGC